MGTLCRKGTASGKETSGAVSQGISPNGSGALEKLRQYRGAGARTGFTSAASVQVARATGAGGAWGTGAQHTGAAPASPSVEAFAGGENDGSGFFQRCLAKSRGSTAAEQQLWRADIYDQIREVMSRQGSLSIERMCQLVDVSRSGFYRSVQEQQPIEEEMEVRSAIQQIAVEHRRRYGYRRISAELRRRGLLVNHKRVARI